MGAAITTMTPPRQLTMITDLIHGESMMAMATATLLLLMMMDGSPPTILLSGLMMELQFQHPPVPPLQGMTMVATVANGARAGSFSAANSNLAFSESKVNAASSIESSTRRIVSVAVAAGGAILLL